MFRSGDQHKQSFGRSGLGKSIIHHIKNPNVRVIAEEMKRFEEEEEKNEKFLPRSVSHCRK